MSIDPVYRIESPRPTPDAPIANAPPPRQVGIGAARHIPEPTPPVVGRTPYPFTVARRPPMRRPTRPAFVPTITRLPAPPSEA